MLRAFCFASLGLTVEDLYLIDPDPERGGHERGVRVELRVVDPQPWRGSPNTSQRIVLDQALWRADFLESVAGGPGTKDRMHHHPGMHDNRPGRRVYAPDLTDDPMAWLEKQLGDLTPLLEAADVPNTAEHQKAGAVLRDNLAEIVATVTTVLGEVRAGTLARPPA
ncbi:hypothetical protein J4573_00440 [Actinomadura barringtoniae]|uniref:Uncharacterized protein n=1 Tax=Actinomadura barringtoniae TaxID=1427535 RepID=A0A939P930_9ACTN|nr:hypothetical protein [Actinomadura barringtoniae]MBO2445548.1 hypothetical protein [Actinomadura barringtoniae]